MPPDGNAVERQSRFDKIYKHKIFLENLVWDSIQWSNDEKTLVFHVNIIHDDENSLTCIAGSLLSLVYQYINDGGARDELKESVWWEQSEDEEMSPQNKIQLHVH